MNFAQGLMIGFIAGALYVTFALPWIQKKLDRSS